jgi:mono/diheme cytochrome c family protein
MVLAAALLGGCRQQKMEVMEDSGQATYLARCAVCHGENREGRAGMYPALAGSEWVDGQPERLAAIILDGIQGRVGNYEAVMPGWGPILGDAEIAAVMTWLRREDGKGPVTAVEVNHARVETAGRNTFWTADELRDLRLK